MPRRRTTKAESKIPPTKVMSRKCRTCPFNCDKRGKYADPELVAKIEFNCVTKNNQICHHPRLDGKESDHLCRGARNYQLQVFYRMGVLDAATDEAWAKLVEEQAGLKRCS